MKAKLFFYGRNIIDGVAIAMSESMKLNGQAISKNKKSFLILLFMAMQISFAFAQDTTGTTLITQFQAYATPIYVIGSIVITIVLVYSNLHTVIKGINGDTEAWKKLGGAGAWIVIWFVVVPFLYKMFMAKVQNNANPLQ